jgi:hypothetical protein
VASDLLKVVVNALESIDSAMSRGEPVAVNNHMLGVPVVLRALLAAVALASADRPVNSVTMAEAGGYARGTASTKNKDALAVITRVAKAIADTQLGHGESTEGILELSSKVQERDATIATLRAQLAQSKSDLDVVVSYARDLHNRLQGEFDAVAAERAEKVRTLRPVMSEKNDYDPA